MPTYPSTYVTAAPSRRVEEQRDRAIALAQRALLRDEDHLTALTQIALIDTEDQP